MNIKKDEFAAAARVLTLMNCRAHRNKKEFKCNRYACLNNTPEAFQLRQTSKPKSSRSHKSITN